MLNIAKLIISDHFLCMVAKKRLVFRKVVVISRFV